MVRHINAVVGEKRRRLEQFQAKKLPNSRSKSVTALPNRALSCLNLYWIVEASFSPGIEQETHKHLKIVKVYRLLTCFAPQRFSEATIMLRLQT